MVTIQKKIDQTYQNAELRSIQSKFQESQKGLQHLGVNSHCTSPQGLYSNFLNCTFMLIKKTSQGVPNDFFNCTIMFIKKTKKQVKGFP